MNKVTPEQGEAILIAVNKITYGIALIATGKDADGQQLVAESTKELQDLGVPIEA
jgi:hypothetical protein